MEFPKENVIDSFINEFEKDHPILSRWIRFKLNVRIFLRIFKRK